MNISVEEVENIFKEAINKATKDVYKETFYLLYAKILKENKNIDENIFTAFTNVNTDCLISYIKDGKEYSFLDEYDNKE